ncbi:MULTISPECIES: YqkE family protein [Paraliobacillus]|uniref:YqkE family protein n=1 Tax=Paraliobacillus TaxID=200903 RepID=UPI000DD466B4|nr:MULTISPECIES: YqkE family protein [Paraliobacillus]
MSKNEEINNLKDRLDPALLKALQSKKESLKQVEADKVEKIRKQQIAERKEREANKSFEELLGESDLNWKKFK